jgi:hypothetical protein
MQEIRTQPGITMEVYLHSTTSASSLLNAPGSLPSKPAFFNPASTSRSMALAATSGLIDE